MKVFHLMLLAAGVGVCVAVRPNPESRIIEVPQGADPAVMKHEAERVGKEVGESPNMVNEHEINGVFMLHAMLGDSQMASLLQLWRPIYPKIEIENDSEIRGVSLSCPDIQAEPLSWGQKFLNLESLSSSIGLGGFKHNPTWGSGVDVFIVDSGVNCDHEELAGHCLLGDNFVSTEEHLDLSGHGTHIAGIISGTTYGVAKSTNIISIKVLEADNSGLVSSFIGALEWATRSAQNKVPRVPTIINLSLTTGSVSSSMNDAVAAAAAAGILVVSAAGNQGADACDFSPAASTSSLTVGIVTTDDSGQQEVHSSSNTGTCVNIFAPGLNIKAADPVCNDCYKLQSGSSMSAPHVVGVAAAYWSTSPSASYTDVWTYLTSNALPGLLASTLGGSPDLSLHIPCTDTASYATQTSEYNPVQGNCHAHYASVGAGKGSFSYPKASPENSVNYKNNEFTCFNIECPGNMLEISLTYMDLEAGYDFLRIGTLGSLQAYTGTELQTIMRTGSTLLLFHSDVSVVRTGFALEYECHSLGAGESHAPPPPPPSSPAPTPTPTTAAPVTPVPAPVAEGTTKLRITTNSGLYDGSVGTYDVTLEWDGGVTAVLTVVQPATGSVHILEHVGGGGFPGVEALISVTVEGQDAETSNDDWHIASLDAWKEGVWWEQWSTSEGDTDAIIDRDSVDFPSSVVFVKQEFYPSTIELTTGSGQWDGCSGTITATFIYRNGVEEEVSSFTPDSGTFSLSHQGVYPFEEVVGLRFNGEPSDTWRGAAKVNGVSWLSSGDTTFSVGGTNYPNVITMLPSGGNTVSIQIETTDASGEYIPISFTFGGVAKVVGYLLGPQVGVMTFTTDYAAGGPEQLQAVTFDGTNIHDTWTTEYLEVLLSNGSWSRMVLQGHETEGGVALGVGSETSLVYEQDTLPLFEVTLKMITSTATYSATARDIKFTVRNEEGEEHVVGIVSGFASGSVTVLTSTSCPFHEDDVKSLVVEHMYTSDNWRYTSIALVGSSGSKFFVRSDGLQVGWSGVNKAHTLTLEGPVESDDEFNVKITTNGGVYSASSHTYPIELVFADGSVDVVGTIVAPQRGNVHTLSKSIAQEFSDLLKVSISEDGGDGWYIDSVKVNHPVSGYTTWYCNGEQKTWIKDEAGRRLCEFVPL